MNIINIRPDQIDSCDGPIYRIVGRNSVTGDEVESVWVGPEQKWPGVTVSGIVLRNTYPTEALAVRAINEGVLTWR